MRKLTYLLIAIFAVSSANAAIMLTINEYSSSVLDISVSGTVPAGATEPLNPGVFFVAPSADLSTQFYTGGPSLVSNSLTIGGGSATAGMADNGSATGDSLYFFTATSPRPSAGTSVSGSARFTGSFDATTFSASDFSLYLGMLSNQNVGVPLASVPEASNFALIAGALCLISLAWRRR